MTSIVDAAQYLFTSESVTEGHPDKMCDQVSDAILDAIIREDPNARVACETATTTGLVMVLGEISTTTYIDIQAVVRKSGQLPYLRPDGKTQVTVEYERGIPKRVRTVVVSAQHDPDVRAERLRQDIVETVILPTIPGDLRTTDPVMHVNPTGRFVTGGPMGDAGLTGRKIIVDSYGGMARHGGGAFSGKDP